VIASRGSKIETVGIFPSPASLARHLRCFLSLFCVALLLPGCALVVREAKKQYIRVESAISSPEITITLQDSFIRTYRNRATIETMYAVDRADRRPHPAYMDGDFHVSGRANNIALPIVAEIKNAAFEADALALILRSAATGTPVRLTGAWRLWMEHVGRNEELQGEAVPLRGVTDPDHVFEIHPVSLVGDRSLRESFHPVAGYRPQEANSVFESFKNISCRIVREGGTTRIVTRKRLYNDVEFLLEILEEPQQVVEDGRFVNAAVFDLKNNLLEQKVRMVFVKDTPPDRIVKHLRPGNRLHVFGLPRINLAQIAWRTGHSKDHPESLNLPLPYEMIIAGVYEDQAAGEERGRVTLSGG
jgi:hypothetical protein